MVTEIEPEFHAVLSEWVLNSVNSVSFLLHIRFHSIGIKFGAKWLQAMHYKIMPDHQCLIHFMYIYIITQLYNSFDIRLKSCRGVNSYGS